MKSTVTLFVFLISCSFVAAQNDSTSVQVEKTFLGYQYVQNDTTVLMPMEMLEIFQHHPQAYNFMKKARTRKNTSQVLTSVGSLLLGFAVVSSVTGFNQNWGIFAAGSSLIVVGIPFSLSYHKHAQSATSVYNEALVAKKKVSLHLGFSPQGLGCAVRF